jgi:hypothetical protein
MIAGKARFGCGFECACNYKLDLQEDVRSFATVALQSMSSDFYMLKVVWFRRAAYFSNGSLSVIIISLI